MPFGSHHGISRSIPAAGLAGLAGLAALAAGSPAGAELNRFFQATGAVSVSVNAGGSPTTLHSIVIDKPSATAEVASAFVMATSRDGRFIEDGDVMIAGQRIAWERQEFVSQPNFPNFAHNVQADVTATVKPLIDAAEPGPVSFDFTEIESPTIEGEVLVVVFDRQRDPSPVARTVWLAFGSPSPEGDELVLNFKDPVDPDAPGVFADFGLGIASSVQGDPDRFSSGRVVLVDGDTLTSAAGGQDDGAADAGSVITAGGRGDDDANPDDPLAPPTADPRFDDELYSLVPFFSGGETRTRIATFSEGFDNLFFAYFVLSDFAALGPGVFLDPETAVNEVGSEHTVTATAVDSEGSPAPGVEITFTVTGGGPNDGETGGDVSGDDGTAVFSYVGDGGPGLDAIFASFLAEDGLIFSNIVAKQWISTLEIALAPDTAVNEVGSEHTLTATVRDAAGAPQPDVEVTFEVRSGPNAGTTETDTTDGEGLASFTYTGTGGAGVDEIVASLVDPQGNEVTSDPVSKEWILATGVVLAPEVASALVGARHTVVATVADTAGMPQPGIEVTFTVVSGPNAGEGRTADTGDDGTASFTYAGIGGAGLDAIEARFVNVLGATRTSDLATVDWLAPPLADPRPDLAASGDGEILVVRELGTGLTGIAAELVDERGIPLVTEMLTGGDAVYSSPSVARLAGGDYVAVFLRGRPLANAVVGRFVGGDGLVTGGSPVFDRAEVCDFDPASGCPLAHPDAAALPDGGFVAVWQRGGAVVGGIFDAAGMAVGGTFTVAADPTGGRLFTTPEVTALDGGAFAVAYRADRTDSSEVRLARFDASGALAADVPASLFSGGLEGRPAIAPAPPDGRPVVLWESPGTVTGAGIFGRVDPEDPVRPEFQVNSSIDGDQLAPSLAVEPSGLLAAVWLDAERGVLAAQRLTSELIFAGGEFDLEPSAFLGATAAPAVGRPRAVSLSDGTLAVVAGIPGDDADPDGGAALAFTGPTPLAACFEDGRLDASTTRLECVKLRFQGRKGIRPRAGREGR